jgi:hypothetical protein
MRGLIALLALLLLAGCSAAEATPSTDVPMPKLYPERIICGTSKEAVPVRVPDSQCEEYQQYFKLYYLPWETVLSPNYYTPMYGKITDPYLRPLTGPVPQKRR